MDIRHDNRGPRMPVPAIFVTAEPAKPREIIRSEGILRGSLQIFENFLWNVHREERKGLRALPLRWLRIIDLAARGFAAHAGALRASALTYATLLSAVPLFAVAFSVAKALGAQDRIANEIISQLVTGADETVETTVNALVDFIRRAEDYIDKTQVGGLGSLGGIFLFITAFSMLSTIEKAMNVIWGVTRSRTVMRRAIDYLAAIIFAPLLLLVGSYINTVLGTDGVLRWAGPIEDMLDNIVLRPVLAVMPFVSIWLVFLFMYRFMPNTRVPWSSSIIGALIGGTLWMLAQKGYVFYSVRLTESRFNPIFGSFAWLLVLLIWIYISWLILLLGAEVGCAHQYLDERLRRQRPWRGTPAEIETLALRLAVMLARPMLMPLDTPHRPITVERMTEELKLPPEPVGELMDLFCKAGLAAVGANNSEYVLLRQPDRVKVLDVLRLVRHGSLAPESANGAGIFDSVAQPIAEGLGTRTLADLLELPIERVRTFSLAAQKSEPSKD